MMSIGVTVEVSTTRRLKRQSDEKTERLLAQSAQLNKLISEASVRLVQSTGELYQAVQESESRHD